LRGALNLVCEKPAIFFRYLSVFPTDNEAPLATIEDKRATYKFLVRTFLRTSILSVYVQLKSSRNDTPSHLTEAANKPLPFITNMKLLDDLVISLIVIYEYIWFPREINGLKYLWKGSRISEG